MKSFYSGSAVIAATILVSSLLLSAKPSVAETLLSSFQKQTQEPIQISQQDSKRDPAGVALSSDATAATTMTSAEATVAKAAPASESVAEKSVSTNPVVTSAPRAVTTAVIRDSSAPTAIAGATYSATAYSLSGRTASGLRVTKGLIAADPRILPLGTRVRLDAGPYSGEYLVADTGGAVRGKKIDIWTPNNREAFRFGRRLVKLTVLSYPMKRAAASRQRKR